MRACLLVAVLALGACGKPPAVKAAEELADEVCACKEIACATKAAAAGVEKLSALRDQQGSDKDVKAIEKATERAKACMDKLVAGASPGAK
jgi:hypothetical protein